MRYPEINESFVILLPGRHRYEYEYLALTVP